MTPSAAIPQNSQQPSSTTALDEISFSAETTESVNLRVSEVIFDVVNMTDFWLIVVLYFLQEWRAVRSQQDEEYNASLLADIEKVIWLFAVCLPRLNLVWNKNLYYIYGIAGQKEALLWGSGRKAQKG